MQIIFGNCTFITLYLDDITIDSKTFDDHVLHVKQTIDIICEYKLKLKKQKCV
jgi:aspartate/glutamate racemase